MKESRRLGLLRTFCFFSFLHHSVPLPLISFISFLSPPSAFIIVFSLSVCCQSSPVSRSSSVSVPVFSVSRSSHSVSLSPFFAFSPQFSPVSFPLHPYPPRPGANTTARPVISAARGRGFITETAAAGEHGESSQHAIRARRYRYGGGGTESGTSRGCLTQIPPFPPPTPSSTIH
jgi:hypothetical protein